MRAGSAVENGQRHLLEELLACSKEQRLLAVLSEERFRTSELLDFFLEESRAALPFDPVRAGEIIEAATVLGSYFQQDGTTDPDFELERKCHACCLAGTTRRLFQDHQGAEAYFEQVAFLDVRQVARAELCRDLGLLRWDQGRFEEASALLRHAARNFRSEQHLGDQGACRALAGLLAVERMAFSEADDLLAVALPMLDRERQPRLACEASLDLALAVLETRADAAEARTALEQAWSLYSAIPHEEALVRLHWLEGRVAAGLGDTADAEHLLDAVRRKLLKAGSLPEATLATIDLGEALAQAGRHSEIPPLVKELAAAFEGKAGLDLALGALESFAAEASAGLPDHNLWLHVASALRILFPHQGVFFQPVPFA